MEEYIYSPEGVKHFYCTQGCRLVFNGSVAEECTDAEIGRCMEARYARMHIMMLETALDASKEMYKARYGISYKKSPLWLDLIRKKEELEACRKEKQDIE
ncbi:hypothetical protein TKK_0017098 [Trichogramma kaykai]